HICANLVGPTRALVHRSEGCENARAWQDTAGDRVAQLFVGGRAHALDGREAVDERHPRVLGAEKRRFAWRLVARVGAAILEMTADVDVHVDESGQKGAISQVVGHGTRALINLEYLRA